MKERKGQNTTIWRLFPWVRLCLTGNRADRQSPSFPPDRLLLLSFGS
jgi:hypothetical protein